MGQSSCTDKHDPNVFNIHSFKDDFNGSFAALASIFTLSALHRCFLVKTLHITNGCFEIQRYTVRAFIRTQAQM